MKKYLFILLIALSSCSKPKTKYTYCVSGTADNYTIIFERNDYSQAQILNAKSNWIYSFTDDNPARELYLQAMVDKEVGTVEVKILQDGVVIKKAEAVGNKQTAIARRFR